VYRGRVGSGFDARQLTSLAQRLATLKIDQAPCVDIPEDVKGSHWVKPELGARVRFLEWTNEGRVRMGIFLELLDVASSELHRVCRAAPETEIFELALQAHNQEHAAVADTAASDTRADTRGSSTALAGPVRKVVLTNQGKVFWPEEGYTKGELLTYYEAIAPVLLPHLRGRPVMLVRYPDGIAGKNFYQWNVPTGTPSWLRTLELRNEERDGKSVTTFLIDDLDALLHIVNLGCIPIHVLACREETLDECEFITIDFDLGGQPIQTAVILALTLREMLSELGLTGFPKTSGQSGLHVFVPLSPGVPFAAAKVLVELIGHWLQSRHPETSTMERRINQRGDRVYIDTGQTGRSRTIVAPYSVRAHAGATVSMPLFWEEMHLALRPERYSMFTVPALVQDRGDALREWGAEVPNIALAIQRLGRWVSS